LACDAGGIGTKLIRKEPTMQTKEQKKLIKDFKEAVALIMDASSLLDYEDEKNPTYGIKFRCEKFLKKIKKDYCK
jgi:hypothetical protein